ncbi:MAG: hypothetical protein CMP18_01045 [Rickettsiales bacterium]|jgi:microcin C transport system substrate-binding protein|nr:hypothetical protein [Rickettsiales bacterium]|tara:strand:- start:8293 stop:10002 length:1710 start_codon:yes stop_codon:yes gene_type:complete
MNYLKNFLNIIILLILIVNSSFASEFSHHLSILSNPKYNKDFKNFDYVDPNARKGGHVKFGVQGNFNSLNQFILKGISASGLSYLYDSLAVSSEDEISTQYGLVAKSIRLAKNKMSIEFKLRKEAKFHDNKPITVDDIIHSFNLISKYGHPSYQMILKNVKKVIKINNYHVKYIFNNNNRDLPKVISSLPILAKHFYNEDNFTKANLNIPLGSGPYKITKVDPNKSITYQRVKDYWAKDLPVNKGRYNFNKITFDYYRDNNILVEAFKAQKYDVRLENIARNWANSYNIEAIKNNEIIKQEITHNIASPMQAFIINLRKDKFSNIALRKALNLAFNFNWLKKHIFYNSYIRTNSFFPNSNYSYYNNIANNAFDHRKNIIFAQKILEDAGYKIIDNNLIDQVSNKNIEIEFLTLSESFTMVIAPYIKHLKMLGINAKIRMVEENQYKTRVNNFDYDIITSSFYQAKIPGSELYSYFHSTQKNIKGSRNLIGIEDKQIDNIIEKIISAKNIDIISKYCKKLDKILIDNHYVIPQWYNNKFRLLTRNIFIIPKIRPKYSLSVDSWYIKDKFL